VFFEVNSLSDFEFIHFTKMMTGTLFIIH